MTHEPFGPTEELRERAEQVLDGVRKQLDSAHEVQQRTLAATGSATSRDGTVRAKVNATGVLTELELDERAFESSTPKALANLVVATVQAAARAANEQVRTSLSELNQRNDALLATARRKPSELSALRTAVPDVPRTATDPLDDEVVDETPANPPSQADLDRYFEVEPDTEAESPW